MKQPMALVVIESPYRGDGYHDLDANRAYLEECILDCLKRGESPYASHKMLTTALDDRVPEQRALGIEAGFAYRRVAKLRVFYTDRGWSPGMTKARALYDTEGLAYEIRSIR